LASDRDGLSDLERRRQHEQNRLDLFTGAGERNRAGQFATPPRLAREIVRFAWGLWKQRGGSVRFLEPCVGTGSFYSALLDVFPHSLIESAVGVESDSGHAEVARSLWGRHGLKVVGGDFTALEPPRRQFNLLITNPPYVRHHHLSREGKSRLQALVQKQTRVRLSGLSGLYCYFVLLSRQWIARDGLSVWLIPSEFMDVNYGAELKRFLTEHVKLLHIHRFRPTDVQFDAALVSSAVVVFQASPPDGHDVTFTVGGSLARPDDRRTIPVGELNPAAKWSGLTAAEPPAGRVLTVTLGDLFTIKRGLATGANDFFILPRTEAQRRGIPDQFLRPILPPPRLLSAAVIAAGPDGYPLLRAPLALIDCALSEPELRRAFPSFWSYLEEGQRRGVHRRYLTSRRTPWYSQEDRPPAPFLCTYMGRSGNGRGPFRFLWNRSLATAHNVYLLLYPKGDLKEALAADPSCAAAVFTALSRLDAGALTRGGRVYGGGLFKMEPRELANVAADSVLHTIRSGS
jgi:hypothetical protein